MAKSFGRRFREAHGQAQARCFDAQILIRASQDPDHFIREIEQNLLVRRVESLIQYPLIKRCI